jgi:hypothetical protein
MSPSKLPGEVDLDLEYIDRDRRTFLAAATMTLAAAQFGVSGATNAICAKQSGNRNTTPS